MIPEETKQLKLLIAATCAYYGHAIEDSVLRMYVEDLSDLPFAEVATAIRDARRDPKTTRFPLPAVIRDRVRPAESDENHAAEAAARIPEAVAKYGWSNPERARGFIGELGWVVVQRDGGWTNVCQTLNEDNISQLKAQWRNLALVEARRSRMGVLHEAPALPESSRSEGGLMSFGQLLKSIPAPGGNE